MDCAKSLCRPLAAICFLLSLMALMGCGGKKTYPIEGKLTVKDEAFPVKELAGYTVNFESVEHRVSAHGTVEPDGSFRVGTYKDGDGAVAGEHRVAITPPVESEGMPRVKKLIDPRFYSFEKSGLKATVEPGKKDVQLEVAAALH